MIEQDALMAAIEPAASKTLYIVSMPLGQAADLSLRAIRILQTADILAAEDTRTTLDWLHKVGIGSRRAVSYHDHNEAQRAPWLVEQLESGKSVALVSDAGTPLISDPGFNVVALAIERGLPVVAVPGPSAPIVALVGSGLPPARFGFVGFLPRRPAARRSVLAELARREDTLIFFEAPHRVLESLEDMQGVLGDRKAALGWNLTKPNERFVRGAISDIVGELASWPYLHGEITLVVAGSQGGDDDAQWARAEAAMQVLLERGLEPRVIRDLLAELLDLDKKRLYQTLLQLKQPG